MLEGRDDYLSERELWATAVGRFVMEFGEIEWHVDQVLIHIPEVNAFFHKHTDFKIRAAKAIQIVDLRLTAAPQIRKPLVNALNRAMALAPDRNLVAHNPVHLAIYDGDDGLLDFRLQIGSLRDRDSFVSLATLDEWNAEASEIVAMLSEGLRQAESRLDPPLTANEIIVLDS